MVEKRHPLGPTKEQEHFEDNRLVDESRVVGETVHQESGEKTFQTARSVERGRGEFGNGLTMKRWIHCQLHSFLLPTSLIYPATLHHGGVGAESIASIDQRFIVEGKPRARRLPFERGNHQSATHSRSEPLLAFNVDRLPSLFFP